MVEIEIIKTIIFVILMNSHSLNGGFKGWITTQSMAVLCDVGSVHGLCGDLREGLLAAVNCQNCFSSARGISDILSWIFALKDKSPNFFQRNFFNHNFGNNSLNGINYCTNLAEPIPYSSVLVAPHIISQIMLKGITAALPTTTWFRPL